MSDLPAFSGDKPTCPKCGNVGATTRYLSHGTCLHRGPTSPTFMVYGSETNERLHRECGRCSYAWDEALADGQGTKECR